MPCGENPPARCSCPAGCWRSSPLSRAQLCFPPAYMAYMVYGNQNGDYTTSRPTQSLVPSLSKSLAIKTEFASITCPPHTEYNLCWTTDVVEHAEDGGGEVAPAHLLVEDGVGHQRQAAPPAPSPRTPLTPPAHRLQAGRSNGLFSSQSSPPPWRGRRDWLAAGSLQQNSTPTPN